MLPDKSFNPKYFLLEEFDMVEEGDEWYDPIHDQWKKVDSDIEYPEDAAIGTPWRHEEYKPMRRKNNQYIPD